MSTAYILNGYGKYETKDGKRGITLKYGGVAFFFVYDEVTAIPDWTFREVDHAASTPDGEDEGVLTYKTFVVRGERVAEELCDTQFPISNAKKGVIYFTKDEAYARRVPDKTIDTPCGCDEFGVVLTAEVPVLKVRQDDYTRVHQLAKGYKEQVVQEYMDSKRSRMSGAPGQLKPSGLVRVYMNELDIKDLDDLALYKQKDNNADLIKALVDALKAPTVAPVGVK